MMDPRAPTPEERAYHEAGQYMGTPGLDHLWWRPAEKWCPHTFNITLRTGFILLLVWVIGMFISSEYPTPVRLVLWGVYFLCIAAAILLPLLSLKALNWAGQLFWIFFFYVALVWNPYHREGTGWALLWAVIGSAASEIVVRIWLERGGEDNVLTYRVRTVGRILVWIALAGLPISLAGKWGYDKITAPARTRAYLEELKREDDAVAAEKRKREAENQTPPQPPPLPAPTIAPGTEPPPPPTLAQPEVIPAQPVASVPSVATLPIPSREPDKRFTVSGQPPAAGPPTLSYFFSDIYFESGDEPSPGTRDRVINMLNRGEIREDQRLVHGTENNFMWPSNVTRATELTTKRVQQEAARLASRGESVSGMECRIWILDYALQLRGSVIFVHDARLQVDCRR